LCCETLFHLSDTSLLQNSLMRTDLTSLERLEAQIRALPDGTPQGAAWEAALVGWVNGGGHPDLVKGWGWKQWPGRAKAGLPRIERGVDLIAEDRAGRLVAIQAKFRNDPDSPVRTNGTQANLQASATRTPHPTRKPLKTRSSRRRVILPQVAREAAQRAAARGVAAGELSQWLFDRGDGLPPSENTIRSTFQRIKRKAGLPNGLRLHDLRRSMATALGEAHEAVPTIQMALGHSDAATTMKHYAMSTTRIVGDALDRVLQSPAEELSPPNPPPSAENGVDEETEPNLGKVACRAGRAGGERGIRTLDGIAPEPHFQCGAIDH